MYLKRLEIQGFKSFADKVELEFNPGITVVVGPNGSGKSNIVDAIRWVLGEQSAKTLRGLRMDDIIFSGSNTRRPVGMAQVSLTIDNSSGLFPLEYNEVTVTRRLYRSGESEYLINKVPCRMKDIHQLFMDTGVGKEGFSIIGQGKIDEILSLKAEDRRNLLEEAAGIVKYRYRKREAQKKLEDTEQSLVRINDIIFELKEQLGPLEEQAQKARQYQNWKKELDKLEISLAVHSIENNQRKEQVVLEEIRKVEDDITKVSTLYHNKNSKLEEARFEVQRLEKEVSQIQQNYYDTNSELERKEHEIEMSRERKAGLSAQIERIKQELNNLEVEEEQLKLNIGNSQREYKDIENNFNKVLNEVQKITENVKEYKGKLENKTCTLEEKKIELFEILQEKAKANNEIIRIDNEVKLETKRNQQLIDKLTKYEELLKKKNDEKSSVGKLKEELQTKTSKNQEEIKNKEKDLQEIINEIKKSRKLLDTEQRDYQRIQSRLQVLKEMEETGEGYLQGVKVVLEGKRNNKNDYKGVIGTVADVISVPESLELAIETALGGALQYIITENDIVAQKVINFLKKQKKGRATFLPLNTIKGRKSSVNLPKNPDVLGRAVDLINFNSVYKEIMEYLLGKVWIVKNLASAVNIGKENNFSVRMVTLDGDVITPGGALTGGSYNKNRAGLLTRKRLIKELSNEIILKKQEINKISDKLNLLEATQEKIVINITELKEILQENKFKLIEVDKEKERVLKEIEGINSEIELIGIEKKDIDLRLENLAQEKKKQVKLINDFNEKIKKIEDYIDLIQKELKEENIIQNQLIEKLNEKKIKSATLKQAKEMKETKLFELKERLNGLKDNKLKLEDDLVKLKNQINELNILAENSKLKIKELTKVLDEYQNKIIKYKEDRDFLNTHISSLEVDVKVQQKHLDQFKTIKHDKDMKLTKIQLEVKTGKTKLNEHFGISFEEALKEKVEITNKNDAIKRINELKKQIENLGLVNFTAIEEFERVKVRLQFLIQQSNDLEEAKVSLEKVIKEMDQIMVKKFKETFNKVNSEFNGVFIEMFGGGKAYLELSDSSNLLETGIDIIAQPPGKKPQTLSLLSGGERALTAIALLFAILRVKPSPFCVLDEIEAALDEANVKKFANYLEDFGKKTQFIVISHRKGTMEAGNVLYGVTIEDTGVSKVISVKLSDVQEFSKVS